MMETNDDEFVKGQVETQIETLMDRLREEGSFTKKLNELKGTRLTATNYREVSPAAREYAAQCFRSGEKHVRLAFEAYQNYSRQKQNFKKVDHEGVLEGFYGPVDAFMNEFVRAYACVYRAGLLEWEHNSILFEVVDNGFRKGFAAITAADVEEGTRRLLTEAFRLQKAAGIPNDVVAQAQQALAESDQLAARMKLEAWQKIELAEEDEWIQSYAGLVKQHAAWPNSRRLREIPGNNLKNDGIRDRLVEKGKLTRVEGEDGAITWILANEELEAFVSSARRAQLEAEMEDKAGKEAHVQPEVARRISEAIHKKESRVPQKRTREACIHCGHAIEWVGLGEKKGRWMHSETRKKRPTLPGYRQGICVECIDEGRKCSNPQPEGADSI